VKIGQLARKTIACEITCSTWLTASLVSTVSLHIFSIVILSFFDTKWYNVFVYSYEPELFPGLIYRMVKPRIVLLIFVSGKVVLTGKCHSSFAVLLTELCSFYSRFRFSKV